MGWFPPTHLSAVSSSTVYSMSKKYCFISIFECYLLLGEHNVTSGHKSAELYVLVRNLWKFVASVYVTGGCNGNVVLLFHWVLQPQVWTGRECENKVEHAVVAGAGYLFCLCSVSHCNFFDELNQDLIVEFWSIWHLNIKSKFAMAIVSWLLPLDVLLKSLCLICYTYTGIYKSMPQCKLLTWRHCTEQDGAQLGHNWLHFEIFGDTCQLPKSQLKPEMTKRLRLVFKACWLII